MPKTSPFSRMRHEFHELARSDPRPSLNVTELMAIRVIASRRLSASRFRNSQILLRLWKIRMEAQGLFKLRDRSGNVALTHENLSKIIVRLSQLRIKSRRLLKMLLSFRQLALFQKQSTKIDVSIDISRIQLQSLSIFCNGLFWFSVFFQEC